MKGKRKRELIKNEQVWQWVEVSATSGRILKVLLENKNLEYMQIMIRGWKYSEEITELKNRLKVIATASTDFTIKY